LIGNRINAFTVAVRPGRGVLAADAVVVDGDEAKGADCSAKADAIRRELEAQGFRSGDFGTLESIK